MLTLSCSRIPLINSSCFQSEQRCFWLFNTFFCLFLSMQWSQSFCFRQQDSCTPLAAWLPGAACITAWPFQNPRVYLTSRAVFPVRDKVNSAMACDTVSQVPYSLVGFLDSVVLLLCIFPSLCSRGAGSLQQGVQPALGGLLLLWHRKQCPAPPASLPGRVGCWHSFAIEWAEKGNKERGNSGSPLLIPAEPSENVKGQETWNAAVSSRQRCIFRMTGASRDVCMSTAFPFPQSMHYNIP